MRILELEKGGCLRVLLLLFQTSEMKASDFEEFMNYRTFQSARALLKELGLITVVEAERRKQIHSLTLKGKSVAKRVSDIELALSK